MKTDLEKLEYLRSITGTFSGQKARGIMRLLGNSSSLPRLGYIKQIGQLIDVPQYPFERLKSVNLIHESSGYRLLIC